MFFDQITNHSSFILLSLVIILIFIILYLIKIILNQKGLLREKESIERKRKIAERERKIEKLEKQNIEREWELKRLEKEALKKFSIKLQESNRELHSFAHEVAHDLQEPLRKIGIFSNILKKRTESQIDTKSQEYINRIIQAIDRMKNLISGLLIYSRITNRNEPYIPVNLIDVMNEVLSDLEPVIGQAHANIEIEKLPTIKANPLQMHQLIQNLISNGLKYRKKNQAPLLKIYSKSLRKTKNIPGRSISRKYCQLYIKDNGIGIEKKYQEKIFQIFQRLHNREEYDGTGIGLAICQKIVERHEGYIRVQSKLGEGTTFIVTLPVN